jgi:hypothetical protein
MAPGPGPTIDGTGKARGLTLETPELMASAALERRTPHCRRSAQICFQGLEWKICKRLLFDPSPAPSLGSAGAENGRVRGKLRTAAAGIRIK